MGTTFLVVKGGDSKLIGSEFESLPDDTRRIFLTLICCLIFTACFKRPPDKCKQSTKVPAWIDKDVIVQIQKPISFTYKNSQA